jgi:PIN domain nuclease of toxin-antitoxin system
MTGNPRCSVRAREAIEASDAEPFISAASAWEIATKVRAGRWEDAETIANDLDAVMDQFGFRPLPITVAHGRLAGLLPGAHRDPFDRMLAAQAILEAMPLVTADRAFRDFDVQVLW